MAEKKNNTTESQRRQQVRKARTRKDIRKQRMRKKKLTRLAVYALLGVLAVLLILALVAIGRKLKTGRQERAAQEARQEELDNSSLYSAGEVLHLSFPVLTLDGDAEAVEEVTEETEENTEEALEEEAPDDTEGAAEDGEGEEDAETPAPEPVYPKPNLTVSEFRQILQDLYEKGYVLVDMYSLSSATTEGYTAAQVMVPDGKKPLIISQQDVSYSDKDESHAISLIKDSSGKLSCSYYSDSGAKVNGAVDVVPVLEEFIETYPDFSYKGARGILGVTGYRGLLGYQVEKDDSILGTIRIDAEGGGSSEVNGDLVGGGTGADAAEIETADSTGTEAVSEEDGTSQGDAVISSNKKKLEELLSALRANGWHIASNGFGQTSYGSQFEIMKQDADKWKAVLEPIVGTTDIILMPAKADIDNWSGYSADNERYTYLHDLGFRQYCVEDDEAFTWIQVKPEYVRMGIHTIENYGEYTTLMAAE